MRIVVAVEVTIRTTVATDAVAVVIVVLVVVCGAALKSCSCRDDSRSSWCSFKILNIEVVLVGIGILVVVVGRSVGRSVSR